MRVRTRSQCTWPVALSVAASACLLLVLPSCDESSFGPEPWIAPDIDLNPAWSPDGRTIAFYHLGVTSIDYGKDFVRADPDSQGVWFIRPDGAGKRIFLKAASLPAWRPDGQRLAVVVGEQVWTIKVNGDSLAQLTYESTNFFPTWSPDGRWIASSTSLCPGDSTSCGIRLTRSDGSYSYWLTSGVGPDWKPDGTSLVLTGYFGNRRGILRYDFSDGKKHMLYDLGRIGDTEGTSVSASPKYSPDGETIAVGLDFRIWLIDSDGGNPRQVLSDQHRERISWSPDGSQIAYATKKGLWIVSTDGTGKRQVTFPPD